jgi:hypothetical protein
VCDCKRQEAGQARLQPVGVHAQHIKHFDSVEPRQALQKCALKEEFQNRVAIIESGDNTDPLECALNGDERECKEKVCMHPARS